MKDIKSMLPGELEEYVAGLGEPKFRAGQIFTWLGRGVQSFDAMSDISKPLRERLATDAYISRLELLEKQTSKKDGTIKYLWGLTDGNAVETVLMGYEHGCTVCISSQVGCRQGCAFCASTIGGLVRNLAASEMLDEVIYSGLDAGVKVSNIVIMGIGEPLDNYDNVIRFLKLVNAPKGLNIGMRHITLSTCGLTEKLPELAKENLQITLAISLHAPDDETRSRLVPANRGRGVSDIIRACEDYYEATGRRITFEYSMINGVNDSPWQAEKLAETARLVKAHINLILLNRVEEREFMPSSPERMKEFCSVLERRGANYTVRRSLGGDVDASCGQLRRKHRCDSE